MTTTTLALNSSDREMLSLPLRASAPGRPDPQVTSICQPLQEDRHFDLCSPFSYRKNSKRIDSSVWCVSIPRKQNSFESTTDIRRFFSASRDNRKTVHYSLLCRSCLLSAFAILYLSFFVLLCPSVLILPLVGE